jgi:NTE family protein
MKNYFLLITVFLTLSVASFSQYKNLVMEGAGIRGIAYTGAIKLLEEKRVLDSLERIAGTSVGSIVGALLSVGYSADELKEIMFGLKVQTFNDGRGLFIGGQRRMRKNFGWYRGEKIEEWIGNLLKEKTGRSDLTFSALHALHLQDKKYKDLFVTATNLTQQKAETFSWISHPQMKISTAVRISISVPLYFAAVFLDENGEVIKKPTPSGNYQVYVDGGILANYPLQIFDTIPSDVQMENAYDSGHNKTLGLKVERPEQLDWYKTSAYIAPFRINSFRQYISALYNIVIENLNRSLPYEEEKRKTIYINTNNISPKVRKITREQKQLLYDNGMEAVSNFFH